jgi:hypothetical protein
MCSHHHIQFGKIFVFSKGTPIPFSCHPFIFPFPALTTATLLAFTDWLLLDFHVNGVIYSVDSCAYFTQHVRLVHAVNCASMNIFVPVQCVCMFSILLSTYLGAELLSHVVFLHF